MEKELNKEIVYKGKIFDVETYCVETDKGNKSKRDIVTKKAAVVILGVKANGKIILIRQYRFAVRDNIFELPAGFIEDDENSKDAAIREFSEETGYEISNIEKMTEFYVSPGFTNELLILYKADVGKLGDTNFDENENIETFEFSLKELKAMIASGIIKDGKTILGISLYESLAKG